MGGGDSSLSVLQAVAGLQCDCSTLKLALTSSNIAVAHSIRCDEALSARFSFTLLHILIDVQGHLKSWGNTFKQDSCLVLSRWQEPHRFYQPAWLLEVWTDGEACGTSFLQAMVQESALA